MNARQKPIYVDINDTPDVIKLVEELRAAGQNGLLHLDGKDLAILRPFTRPRRRRRQPSQT